MVLSGTNVKEEAGLLNGRPADLAEQFGALLWGDLSLR